MCRTYPSSLSQEQALAQLKDVVESCIAKCDKYSPAVVTVRQDYLYVEFSKDGPFGTTDDVEFYFPGVRPSLPRGFTCRVAR